MRHSSLRAIDAKSRMVRAAAELFHQKGLGATSADDIVRAAGMDQRRFYQYFQNKQGIVHEVLSCYVKAIRTGSAPIKYDVQSQQDLRDWFLAQLELQRAFGMTRSCPFGTIATGVTENDERIREDLCLIFDLVAGKLAAFFTREKAAARLPPGISEAGLADFCIATSQGATLLGKITRDPQIVEAAVRMAIARVETSSQDNGGPPLERAGRSGLSPARPVGAVGEEVARDGHDARIRMIEVAADLFHKQGVAATSTDLIMDASRTGKGQFYYYFKDKEALVHEVLLHHLNAIRSGTSDINHAIDSWEDLALWFQSHIEFQRRFAMTRGCPLGTIGNEITEDDALVQQDLSLIVETIRNKLAAFFVREKALGRLPKSASEYDLASFCIATVQGAMLLAKIKRNAGIAESVVSQTLIHLRRQVAPQAAPSAATAGPASGD